MPYGSFHEITRLLLCALLLLLVLLLRNSIFFGNPVDNDIDLLAGALGFGGFEKLAAVLLELVLVLDVLISVSQENRGAWLLLRRCEALPHACSGTSSLPRSQNAIALPSDVGFGSL